MATSFHCRYQIVSSEVGTTETFDLETVSQLTGIHEELILEYTQAHLVEAVDSRSPEDKDATPLFNERGLLRLRQIAELRDNQHVSLRTLRLIIHMLERLESTETELRALKEKLR